MPRPVTYNGVTYMVPDDATDAEMLAFVEAASKPAQTPEQKPVLSALQGVAESLGGFGEGFAPEKGFPAIRDAVAGIPGSILGVVKLAASTLGTAAGLITDPEGTLASLAESASSLPTQARQALDEATKLAVEDPRAFGRAVAGLTADTGVAFATSKGLPVLSKGTAAKVGPAIENFAHNRKFPLQLAGGAQITGGLATGNPAVVASGLATMAAPSALGATGRRLTKFGTTTDVPLNLVDPKTGAIRMTRIGKGRTSVENLVPPSSAAQVAIGPNAAKAAEENITAFLTKDADKMKKGLSALDAEIAAEKKSAGAIRAGSAKREAAMRVKEEAADLSEIKKPSGYTPEEQELLKRATSVKPANVGPRVAPVQPPAPRTASSAVPEGVGPEVDLTEALGPNVAAERAAERFGRTFVDEGATTPAGSRPAAAIPEAVPEAALDIPQTQSRNPLSTLDNRLTDSDVQALKDIVAGNPAISIEEATAEVLRQRTQRSSMYRNNAGLSKLEQAALDRDMP